jgi:hypothetical protein
LIFGREFQEDGCVFNVALELTGFVYCCLQAASLLEDLLGAVLIVPEIWFTNLCFRLLKLGRFSFGVKETSAAPPREPPGLRTFVSVPQSFSKPQGNSCGPRLPLALYKR